MDEGWVPNNSRLGLYSNRAWDFMFVGNSRIFGHCFFLICKRGIWMAIIFSVVLIGKKKKKQEEKINVVDGAMKKLN